jgi:DNA-binding FrmR family transcriptional regulator
MEIRGKEHDEVVNRLKRARGQIDGVLAMIESGRDCTDVVTQLAAASSAIDRAAFKVLSIGLGQCYVEGQEPDTAAVKRLERLLLSLA